MTRLEAIRERIEHAKGARPDSLVVADMVHLLALVDDLAEKLEEIEHVVKGVADYDAESLREVQKSPHADDLSFTARAYWSDRAVLSEAMWTRVGGIARAALARTEA